MFRAAGALARLAAGIPLRPLGLLGPAPWWRARDRTARYAAARAFFADPFRAPGRWRAPQRGLSGGARPLIKLPSDPGCDPDSVEVTVPNGFRACLLDRPSWPFLYRAHSSR